MRCAFRGEGIKEGGVHDVSQAANACMRAMQTRTRHEGKFHIRRSYALHSGEKRVHGDGRRRMSLFLCALEQEFMIGNYMSTTIFVWNENYLI